MNGARRGLGAGALFVSLVAGSCGDAEPARVFAASSLTDVITAIKAEPGFGVDVDVVFAGSTRLVAQLEAGATGDLLVTADMATMTAAREAGLVGDPTAIATNSLVLAVAPGNPGGVVDIADLGDESLVVGVCAAQVPCGAVTRLAVEALGVTLAPDTEEPNVRSLAGKVSLGEVDAGLIYRTDAIALRLDIVDEPALAAFTNEYQAAVVLGSEHGPTILTALTGPGARAALTAAGFEIP